MNNCTIAGRVTKTGTDKSKSGKTYAKLRVETLKPGVDRDGKPRNFTTRFDVAVYGQDATSAAAIPAGTWIWAAGEVSAKVDEWQGKTYAKLQIIGRVGVIAADFEGHKKEFERQQAPAPAPAPKKEPPAELPPGAEEEDDVPF